MEMELVSRETIKPSEATPPRLRIYPLSFFDHILFRNYVPVIFFYHPNKVTESDEVSKLSMLKKSLSQVLSRYYPFAGRLRDQLSIECNDQGVSLLVTRIKRNLSSILHNPTEALLKPLFPDELQWKEMDYSSAASIAAIQINLFECGGMAISVCMCHKVIDAASLFNFINDWATINREESHKKGDLDLASPVLDVGISVFPQGDLPVFPEMMFVKDNTVCKRFVFEGSKIDSLKALVVSSSTNNVEKNPTRVEVVSALIFRRAVSALGLSFKTTCMVTAVNLRKRMVPPLSDKAIGNISWYFFPLFVYDPLSIENREENVLELHELVSKAKGRLSEFCDTYITKLGRSEKDLSFIYEYLRQCSSALEAAENQSLNIGHTSWCRFPMYEVDFGWGKPIWVSTSGCPARNSIFLMDTRDGNGIEAYVNMEEQDMIRFERDSELLQYASLNPPIQYTC